MNSLSATQENIKLAPWLLISATALMILFAFEFPRILGWFPFLIGIGALAYCRFTLNETPEFPKKMGLALLGILVLASISITWSAYAPNLYTKVLNIAGIFLGGILLYTGLRHSRLGNHPALLLLPLAAGAATFLCILELSFDLQLYRFIHNTLGERDANTSVMNRGIVFLVLLFFPMLTVIKHSILEEKQKKQAIPLYWILTLTMVTLTQSQSAQLAFALSTLTYFAFPYKHKLAYKALMMLVVLAVILTPVIVKFMFDALVIDVNTVPWIKEGYAAERLEIWNFVTSYALNSPIYGHGILATRFVEDFDAGKLFYEGTSVLHPHNFAVQVWVEFGAIGALSASIFLASCIQNIALKKPEEARIFLPVFISALTVAAIGYGMWQSWWLGMLFFIASLLSLIANKAQKTE